MMQIPQKLRQEPLIEAIWELRFESLPASDVLPGYVFGELRQRRNKVTLERLPAADMPALLVQMNPALRYTPRQRISEEPPSPLLWQTGDRIITLNCRKPYIGWEKFKAAIKELIEIMEKSGLDLTLERHSLRYINLLTLDPAPDISALQLRLELGARQIGNHPLHLRFELTEDGFQHVVQIATPAEAYVPDGRNGWRSGTVVDLETFMTEPPVDWASIHGQMDRLHDRAKNFFFTQILTDKAVKRLEPES